MARAIRLDREGVILDGPFEHPVHRVFVEGGLDSGYAVTRDGLRALSTLEARCEFAACALDFRSFLDVWFHINGETGKVERLGDDLWPGQFDFIAALQPPDPQTAPEEQREWVNWVYALKGRRRSRPSHARDSSEGRRGGAPDGLAQAISASHQRG